MKHTEASVRGETRQTGVFVLGITGGVGAGKSTVLAYLHERFGALILECDRIGAQLQKKGSEVLRQIIDTFGEEYLTEDGELDRKKTAALVFADPEALSKLNAIVHPAVKEDILSSPLLGGAGGGLLFIESAILYEAGLDELCDRIIIVDAPEDIRIARTIARDYHGDATPENINKVRARIRAQHPIPFTSPLSPFTFHLTNDGSVSISDLADTILNWLQKS